MKRMLFEDDWKTIKGHPDYIISSSGRILSYKSGDWKELKPGIDSSEYKNVVLDNKTKRVHRIMALAFLDNSENKPEVNHKDGNKQNNDLSNLEWATKRENMIHAYNTGLKTPSGPYDIRKIKINETNEIFNNAADCAKQIKGAPIHIFDCLYGRRLTHKGYTFQFVKED